MKRFHLIGLLLLFSFSIVSAAPDFSPDLRYKIVCQSLRRGALVLGEKHDNSALLYHETLGMTPQDGWWYIEKSLNGYTIRNAETSEFIVHDTELIPHVKNGLSLSRTFQPQAAEWTIQSFNQSLIIRSVESPGQWFTVGEDGSTLAGTSMGSGSFNQRFSIYDESGQNVNPDEEETPLPSADFAESFDSICINRKQLVYDSESKTYYYSLPQSVYEGQDFSFDFTYRLRSHCAGYTVRLDKEMEEDTDGHFILFQPDCHTRYVMTLYNANGQQVAQSYLQFTYLPLVEITLDYCSANRYTDGTIRVTDGNHAGTDSVFHARFKYRGNTSLRYDKKSFNIKLKDQNGHAMDRSFFGLRSDNRWILDAMTIDRSCMRNRVAMDLWNDYATPPYYATQEKNVRTGTRGHFVEVFWNGAYHGLFCMSERIDRKQLKLKKFVPQELSPNRRDEVHGLLYKGKEWCYEVLMGSEGGTLPGRAPAPYQNLLGQERWANYDIKYPDYETEAVEWKPLYDCVHFVATSSQTDFERNINKYLDLPVLTDFYLLLDIMIATDNHGKNMYYFAYDYASPSGRKLSVAPWDLDATFALDWQGNINGITPLQTIDDYLGEGNNGYFIKLKRSQRFDWKHLLSNRYAQLRTTYFSKESLMARFNGYAALFAASGADQREQDRWGDKHNDIQGGVDYINNWLDAHIDFLDEYYGFDPEILAVNQAHAENRLHVTGGPGYLTVSAGKTQTLPLYNISGQLVRYLTVHEGTNRIGQLLPGIYLIGKQKVLVK